MRVAVLAIVFACAFACLQAALASAKSPRFSRCGTAGLARCGTVTVPIDRSGGVPGSIPLHVKRIRVRGPSRTAVFVIAGGPGQAAAPFAEDTAVMFRKALKGRDIVAFDQRGTGRSAALRCPTLDGLRERLVNFAGAGADCAELLGQRRAFYTTRDSVEDIEAVRQATAYDRITLYGVSYGTKLALAYAAAHPDRVERLVLDSVVTTDGPDPLSRESIGAVPRVLRQLCGVRACKRFTRDPAQDVASLMPKFVGGRLRGERVRDSGKIHSARMGRVRVVDLLLAGDFDPTLRAGFPAAVRSAVNGDPAPLLRLSHRAGRTLSEPDFSFSNALFVTTRCEEGPLPWTRTTPFPGRLEATGAAVASTSEAALFPLDRETILAASEPLLLCRLWPSSPIEPRIASSPLPDVPTLVVSGETDLRTPTESAERVANLFPRATLVKVPNVGHSALDWPNAGCARRALKPFFTGRPVRGCRKRKPVVPVEQIAPTSFAQLAPPPGFPPRAGRTLVAVRRTLEDVGVQILSSVFALDFFRTGFGGLRGGRARITNFGIALERVRYVPGVILSGELRGENLSRGFLRVSGPRVARGRLRLRHGVLTGRLGRKRIRLRLPPQVLGGEERSSRRRGRGESRFRLSTLARGDALRRAAGG